MGEGMITLLHDKNAHLNSIHFTSYRGFKTTEFICTAKKRKRFKLNTTFRSKLKCTYLFFLLPTDPESLPILVKPQDMFDDLCARFPRFSKFAKALGRPLRVATMCSGTESPILALSMMCKAVRQQVSKI